MDLTVEGLKQLAATVVAGFSFNNTSLNDGIIKAASDNNLNPEQIKRLIETSNQMAYLTKMAEASDRTFEFPVAEYDTVISHFLTPEGIQKEASSVKKSPLDIAREVTSGIEKTASAAAYVMSESELLKNLSGQFYANRDALDAMEVESYNIADGLRKQASVVKSDPEALKKIAQFCNGDSSKFEEISRLVFGHVKEASASDIRGMNVMSVKSLSEMLDTAKSHQEKKASLKASLEKAAGIIVDTQLGKDAPLEKKASLASFLLKRVRPKSAASQASNMAASGIRSANSRAAALSRGAKTAIKGVGVGGTTLMGGVEVAQISAGSRPRNDVWKSLHN